LQGTGTARGTALCFHLHLQYPFLRAAQKFNTFFEEVTPGAIDTAYASPGHTIPHRTSDTFHHGKHPTMKRKENNKPLNKAKKRTTKAPPD